MPKSNEFAFDGSVRSFDANGNMHVAVSPITKAAVNPYYGREIPDFEQLGLQPDKVYYLLRDPVELEKAVSTFNGLPLLIKHKPVAADDLPKSLIVGTTGNDAEWCDPYIKVGLSVWDAGAIAGIQTKEQTELSSAYRYIADMTPGVYRGVRYDGVMRDIQGNHVALVDIGRAGSDVVVQDSNPFKEQSMTEEEKKALAAKKHKAAVARAQAIITPLLGADAKPEAVTKALLALAMDADPEPEKPETKPAADGGDDEEEDDPDNPGQKRKKVPAANDEETDLPDGQKKPEGAKDEGTEQDNKKPAMDRASVAKVMQIAEDRAVLRIESLYKARETVKPLVGQVAMDNADDVYRFALEQHGISTKGVHPSAFPAMTNMLLKQKEAQAAGPLGKVAMDSKMVATAAELMPDLLRFKS